MAMNHLRPSLATRWTTTSAPYAANVFFSPDSALYFGFWRTKPLYLVNSASAHRPLVNDDLTFQWELELSTASVLLFRLRKLVFLALFFFLAILICFQFFYSCASLGFFSSNLLQALLWGVGVFTLMLGLFFFVRQIGGVFFYLFLGIWGALFSLTCSSSPVSFARSRADFTPYLGGFLSVPTHRPNVNVLLSTYRVFNYLSFTPKSSVFPLSVDGFFCAPIQPSSFSSWFPAVQTQLMVPSVFQFKGLSNALIQPQFFSQTLNTASWLFLRGLHQANTTLPVAPAAQSADLWAFHRELKLFWAGAAVATIKPCSSASARSSLSFDVLTTPSLRAFTFLVPNTTLGFFWQKFLFSSSFYSGSWFWVCPTRSLFFGTSLDTPSMGRLSSWL